MKNQTSLALSGIKISIFLVSLVAFSCTTQHPPEPKETTKENFQNNFEVKSADAIKVADNFSNDINDNSSNELLSSNLRIKGDNPKKEVEKIEIVRNKSNKDIFHVINYKNNKGFSIISADKRLTPVLAYSDKGFFSIQDTVLNNGLKIWFSIVEEAFIKGTNLDKPDKTILLKWEKYQNEKPKKGKIKNTNLECGNFASNVNIGPLTEPIAMYG